MVASVTTSMEMRITIYDWKQPGVFFSILSHILDVRTPQYHYQIVELISFGKENPYFFKSDYYQGRNFMMTTSFDPFARFMIFTMVGPSFLILVGCGILLWRRNHRRLRPTFPELTVASCIGYIIVICSNSSKNTQGIGEPCVVVLWTLLPSWH